MAIKALILLFLFELFTPYFTPTVKANDDTSSCVVQLESAKINWTTGLVQAKGRNRQLKKRAVVTSSDLPPIEAATENARQNLFEILKSITLFNNLQISTEKMLTLQLKKIAFGAKIVQSRTISKTTAEVVLETTIYGDFLNLALPPEIEDISDVELLEPNSQYLKNQGVRKYTGMVIDARDIEFKPTICPIVVSEQAEEIYSPQFISRKYAIERGVCTYICSSDPAIISQKAGNNPVTIKGLRKDSDKNHSIVISISDADRIQKMAERHLFMKGCKVVILL
ncbi:MAG: hypothetical protein HQK74_07550 [Desulfamplus sp.]|nr:hypothetical protein [Desulfamplus sp.]